MAALPSANILPTPQDIVEAASRIKSHAFITPVIHFPELDQITGARVFIKAEMLQRTGTFKFRGAFNRLLQLTDEERKCGVVAYSSGNHAQGVAAAAQILGISATIIMPSDAPKIKIDNTKTYGATIRLYDRYTEDRHAIGQEVANETRAILVPPYDDKDIIAGQGTAGLEFIQQMHAKQLSIDTLLCCCGGGGLIAGCALAFFEFSPNTAIYSVEPAEFNDMAVSLASGKRESNAADARSICDALLASEPGKITFEINKKLLRGGLTVTDDEVKSAIAFAFTRLKLVLEPGGAVALAAALHKKIDIRNQVVGIVCSGGNIDPAALCEYVNEAR